MSVKADASQEKSFAFNKVPTEFIIWISATTTAPAHSRW